MPELERSRPRTAGRLARRKMATRLELLRAGRRLFSERGLYEARIEDLAESAGIAKGTLYLYFKSREELVQAVVEAGFEDLHRQVSAAVKGERTLYGLVDRIVQAHLDFFAANPDLLRVFHQARGILKFHRPEWLPLRRPLERHVERLGSILGSVPSPVRRRPGRRRVIAVIVFGAISGSCSVRTALEWGPGPDRWSLLLREGLAGLAVGLARRDEAARDVRNRGGGA